MSSLHTLCFTFVVRLLDAYKAQDSMKDRELLLSALKCGKNQRYLTFFLTLIVMLRFGGWGGGGLDHLMGMKELLITYERN